MTELMELSKRQLEYFLSELKTNKEENFCVEIKHENNKSILIVEIEKKTISTTKKENISLEETNIEVKITEILNQMGMKSNIKGFNFIRTAIKICLSDSEYLNFITKNLYPDIAKKYDTTGSKVERGIRHAIESTWKSGNIAYFKKVFGSTIPQEKAKPTNSEFISLLVDKIKLKMI